MTLLADFHLITVLLLLVMVVMLPPEKITGWLETLGEPDGVKKVTSD